MAQLVARLNGIQKVRGSNPLGSTTKIPYILYGIFVYFQGDCANLEKFVPRRCRANPCGLTLRNVNKFTFFAITEASESLPTNPLGSTKKISYILYGIFLCKDKGFSVIYHGVALQHEPLRADNKRRETQARSICGHRVQFHSQQIRHEVSAKGAVQCTIC